MLTSGTRHMQFSILFTALVFDANTARYYKPEIGKLELYFGIITLEKRRPTKLILSFIER